MSGHLHFVGVAGVGMSALAQAAQHAGYDVSGSDRFLDNGVEFETTRKLKSSGIRLFAQDGSGIKPTTEAVVISTAIEKDNLELAAAARLGVPVVHRAAMLARLTDSRRCIAVTGTSGKSTVTGMIGWILGELGVDPTVVNGAPVLNWKDDQHIGNIRAGQSDWWVIEADESDKSLVAYRPEWGVLTNISMDHFSVAEAEALFEQFRQRVKQRVIGPTQTDAQASDIALHANGARFTYRGVNVDLPLCGRHNVDNALLAVQVCEALGHPLPPMATALAKFKGIHRRLERVAEVNGIWVIDDYGHNPAKITASWQAVAGHRDRVHGIWRPHGYGPLATMMNGLVDTFGNVMRAGDRLAVLPVYDVGGTADRSISSSTLTTRLRTAGCAVSDVADYEAAIAFAVDGAKPGDAVLLMGARDPELPKLAGQIAAAISDGAGVPTLARHSLMATAAPRNLDRPA